MNTCSTCPHWISPSVDTPNRDDYRAEAICEPYDPDTHKPAVMPWPVRMCKHPAQTRFERPVERNGFGLTDGGGYFAALVTGPDFGCVRHPLTEAVSAQLPDESAAISRAAWLGLVSTADLHEASKAFLDQLPSVADLGSIGATMKTVTDAMPSVSDLAGIGRRIAD